MPKHRHSLPQIRDHLFVTDGGLETTLVFHDKLDLPAFAAFPLLDTEAGRQRLADYYREYLAHAAEHGLSFILEAPTWRANPDWAAQLGYSREQLAEVNRRAIDEMVALRWEFEGRMPFIVISGNLGPRGDGYVAQQLMTPEEAETYHGEQIAIFATTEADLISAFTLNYVEEAIGIVRAAQRHGLPSVISFTVETDGRLPSGQPLDEAIAQVDAATGGGPAYYMINCAHPTHFADLLASNAAWVQRIRGLRVNASRRSHAELNESTTLDEGDPAELGREIRALRTRRPHLTILGGCCGTDARHIAAICKNCSETLATA
jgi:S-methylmethionine-dependent homocysteine/selenocysteine methylase